MIAVNVLLRTPDGLEVEFGGFLDSERQKMLPLLVKSRAIAQTFIDACERTGNELHPDMMLGEMRRQFELWHDAYKRSEPAREAVEA